MDSIKFEKIHHRSENYTLTKTTIQPRHSSTSAIAFSFFNLGAWGAIYAYTPELYPTEVRGTGTGWAGAMARIGGGIAPILAGKIMEAGSAALAVLVIAVVAIAGALDVLALGEETMGRELS